MSPHNCYCCDAIKAWTPASHIATLASVVYKEWSFRSAALDVFFLTAMVSWIQLVLTWVFLPLQVQLTPCAILRLAAIVPHLPLPPSAIPWLWRHRVP